jgi:hypothetical protein
MPHIPSGLQNRSHSRGAQARVRRANRARPSLSRAIERVSTRCFTNHKHPEVPLGTDRRPPHRVRFSRRADITDRLCVIGRRRCSFAGLDALDDRCATVGVEAIYRHRTVDARYEARPIGWIEQRLDGGSSVGVAQWRHWRPAMGPWRRCFKFCRESKKRFVPTMGCRKMRTDRQAVARHSQGKA